MAVKMMKTYILKPDKMCLLDILWKSSPFHGVLVIRAKNEHAARKYAAYFFNTASLNKKLPIKSPWINTVLVSCVEISCSLYSLTGGTGILHPSSLRNA